MLTSSSNSIGKTTDSVTDGKPVAEEGQEPGRSRAVILAAEVGGQRDQAVVLTPGRWGIGSAYSNQIVIDQETVAPRHAMIIVTEHRVLMTSWANATYVNEERCRESLLCAGDVLTLGTIDLKLRAAEPSELISQLPDVSAETERSATIQPVSGEETLRRLDDLDTALGLLEDELGGSEESADQLNELIEQIESDITRRSNDRADQSDSDDQPTEAFGESSVSESSETEPANVASNDWDGDEPSAEAPQSHNLDDLMGAVVADAAAETQWATHQNDAHIVDDVDAEFSEDDTASDADEFAELVGSTSVLAQNLTLNALRSRAEAVRQLDEMILAASASNELPETQAASESRTVGPAGSAAGGGSDAGFAESAFEGEAKDAQPEDASDDWDAEAASDESFVADEAQSESVWSDKSEESDWGASEDTTASDTVEFSAMDTVNEAGSLLSSLFREESVPEKAASELTVQEELSELGEEPAASNALAFAADEQEPSETDATWGEAETQPVMDSEPEFSWGASANEELFSTDAPAQETPEAVETSEDVAGVRSRLAEMFDMPALATAQPQSFEAEGASGSEADSFDDFPATTSEPRSDQFAANDDAGPAAPQTSGMQLASWLDGMKSAASQPEADSGDAAAADEDADEVVESVADDLEPSVDEASIEATPSGDVTGGEAEDSVAAYMRDLLARNRARHGQPERPEDFVVMPSQSESEVVDEDESVIGQETAEETVPSVADADADTDGDVADQQSWLSQEPKHQLDKDRMRADAQALREVANETARCAVTRATRQKLKLQVAVKTTASVVMLGCGVTASLLGVSTLFAALVMGVGAYFAFDLGLTIVRNWKCITA
jgi:pSer/pThr/pTyr-binding forkhead associated (FHA) protein